MSLIKNHVSPRKSMGVARKAVLRVALQLQEDGATKRAEELRKIVQELMMHGAPAPENEAIVTDIFKSKASGISDKEIMASHGLSRDQYSRALEGTYGLPDTYLNLTYRGVGK